MANPMNAAGRRRYVLDSFYSVIALVLILIACVELCDASTVVDVYRLIQYDISGAPFGSRAASLNHHAGSSLSAPGSDLSRTVAILSLRELNETFIQEYIEQGKPLGGLLLLLPQAFSSDYGSTLVDDCSYTKIKKQLADLEQKLIHSTIQYPVYFAFEDEDLAKVLADIQRNDAAGQPATATTGGYKLIVTSPAPKKIASPTITNIQGWLPGLKADGDSNQLPTIAIVASYDTFGAAPALSVGSDSNGSGVVALEIARLFSILYSNPNTRGRYNILFGLTSGGPYNYNGTRKVSWEHEQFSRSRVTTAALSGVSVAPNLMEHTGGISDKIEFINEDAVVESVKLAAESLARHIYGQEGKNINIFTDKSSLAVNPACIGSWLDLLSKTPRVAPFLSKDNTLLMALKKELADHVVEVNLQHDVIDGMFTFYDSTVNTL